MAKIAANLTEDDAQKILDALHSAKEAFSATNVGILEQQMAEAIRILVDSQV